MVRTSYTSNRKAFDQKVEKAILVGMNKTLGDAVPLAKEETPWVTGTARGSIKMTPAHKEGNTYVGEFGSYDCNYFIWLEIGHHTYIGRLMLRRAADATFPQLNANIKSAFNGENAIVL